MFTMKFIFAAAIFAVLWRKRAFDGKVNCAGQMVAVLVLGFFLWT